MVAARGECGGDCGDAMLVLAMAMAATYTLCRLIIRFHEKCTHIVRTSLSLCYQYFYC